MLDSAKALGNVKKIDLFEPARLDGVHSIEKITQSLKTLVDEGLISYIGLSEVNADTLRRACKVFDTRVPSWRTDMLNVHRSHKSTL